MSNDVNTVIISGRLTRNPELRRTPSGAAVLDFAVASNQYKGDQQFTTFVKVTLWNQSAEWFSQRLGVGDHVMIQGRLGDDNFEDKKNGNKTSGRLKVIDPHVTIVNSVKKNESTSESPDVASIPEA
jgi:single-strand DNA-binding protein